MSQTPASPRSRSVLFRALAASLFVVAPALAWTTSPAAAAEFREPVTLATKDGVLEVRLTARQVRFRAVRCEPLVVGGAALG